MSLSTEQLREGAALLAWYGKPEDGPDISAEIAWHKWCDAHAAELLADAGRYQWLCDGHGYFLEEEMICGHPSTADKAQADAAIDAAMASGADEP